MRNRGLLTDDDRRFFSGEKQPDEPDEVRREKRHNIKQRIGNIVKDLDLLADAGETDLVDEFHAETDRDAKLEAELAALRQQLATDPRHNTNTDTNTDTGADSDGRRD